MKKINNREEFNKVASDLEKSIIKNKVDEKTESLRNWMWFFLFSFLVILVFGGLWLFQGVFNKNNHFTQEELQLYTRNLETTESGYNRQWTLKEFQELIIDETGERGTTIDDVIDQFGQPRSAEVLQDFGGVNRISISYDDSAYYGLSATLYFQNIKGSFRLYKKIAMGSGIAIEGLKVADEANYQFLWTSENYDSLDNGTSWSKLIKEYGLPSSMFLMAEDDLISIQVFYGKTYKDYYNQITLSMSLSGDEYLVSSKSKEGELGW